MSCRWAGRTRSVRRFGAHAPSAPLSRRSCRTVVRRDTWTQSWKDTWTQLSTERTDGRWVGGGSLPANRRSEHHSNRLQARWGGPFLGLPFGHFGPPDERRGHHRPTWPQFSGDPRRNQPSPGEGRDESEDQLRNKQHSATRPEVWVALPK